MTIKPSDETIQTEKLAIILDKKENLKIKIALSEKRIDEKIAALMADGFITAEIPSENIEVSTKPINGDQPDIFSEIDLSDDDALDQAVRSSKPSLAFSRETDPFEVPIAFDSDDELPTISKILGRSPDSGEKTETLNFEELLSQTQAIPKTKTASVDVIEPVVETPTKPIETPIKAVTESQISENKINSKKPGLPKKEAELDVVFKPTPKPNAKDMILPSFLFLLGIIACGVFLVGFSVNFSFIDYSILFILLTCLIFTIALPYAVSLFFMGLITVAYGVLIIVSTFYFELPFNGYQLGWLIIIPLILFGSTLLIRRIRELYHFKKELEGQISAFDAMDQTLGLTTEKSYYKDLKHAMDRASVNEIILAVEMISISHLETLRSMNGARLWDEILYKTLKIIKKHSYSTHLIYVLEGNIFSVIMENTSMKNQLMINQSIRDDFDALIKEYEVIDVPVSLKIAVIPYSREISNPLAYRTLGFKHLDH